MLKASEVAELLNGKIVGDANAEVDSICSVTSSKPDCLTIVLSEHDFKHIADCRADIIVGPEGILSSGARTKIVIDQLDVGEINQLLRYYKVNKYHLDEQENVSSNPDVYLGKHARIGKGCYFMPGVKIMNGAVIGDNVAIHANTVIKEGTVIGNNVTIDSNCSIGNFSFEYMRGAGRQHERIDSVGRVIIQDDVEIGCNTTIDRGTLGDTVIGRGTKIDNLVQIGHDCKIGQSCLLVSQSGIAGHSQLGNGVIMQAQTGVAGYINIGDQSSILAKSGVSRSCPPKSRLFGIPARDSRAFLKRQAILNSLAKTKAKAVSNKPPQPELKPGIFQRFKNLFAT